MPTVQTLLDQGEATHGFTVKTWGGHLILGRVDEAGPDPRFRLTPLGGGRYDLSLYERNRWDPLPYQGTLNEMVDVINNHLGPGPQFGQSLLHRATNLRNPVLSVSLVIGPAKQLLPRRVAVPLESSC